MRCSAQSPNLLATGGKENPLKIWDLTSQEPSKPIFTSKNIKNDWLELRVPVSESDFRFLENNDLVATCTANHFIRLYDMSSNCRRPVVQIKWSDHPFTTMCLTFNERQVIVGSSRGFMGLFDLRAPGKLIHAFKGFAGSISAVEAHPTEPYVAGCGLDRFVLVHNVKTKKLLHKIYCKAHLNALLLKEDLSIL
uniref:WD repeat-containing protein 74 n=1 Tax=Romanomermis culicivorax TaxID=13658 RepID=A0A915JVV8_ROMCU